MRAFAIKSGLLFLFLVIISTPIFAHEDLAELKQKIESIRHKMVKAQIAGDLSVGWAIYTNDIVAMPNYDEMTRGKEAYKAKELAWKKAGVKFHALNHSITDLWTIDDLVIEVGNYGVSLTLPNTSGPVSDRGNYVTVWQQQADGSLKMKIDIWNTDVYPHNSSN